MTTMPTFARALLIVSGLLAATIGTALLIAPVAFHAASGTDLGRDANLLSEIRAPGGALLVLGMLMLVGAFDAAFHRSALTIGAAVFLAYGLARVVSLVLDGLPADGLLLALVIELAIGAACLMTRLRMRAADTPHGAGLEPLGGQA